MPAALALTMVVLPGFEASWHVQDECTQCPRGTFRTADMDACASCPSGSYADEVGATVCSLCSEGTFSSASNTGAPPLFSISGVTCQTRIAQQYSLLQNMNGRPSYVSADGSRLLHFEKMYPPYLVAAAEGWDSGKNRFFDASGNGRHGVLTAGSVDVGSISDHGASIDVPFVGGTTETKIEWPAGSLPSTFTMCSITRYTSSDRTRQQRVLGAKDGNVALGHWGWGGTNPGVGTVYYHPLGKQALWCVCAAISVRSTFEM
jgi:hypothetical protein